MNQEFKASIPVYLVIIIFLLSYFYMMYCNYLLVSGTLSLLHTQAVELDTRSYVTTPRGFQIYNDPETKAYDKELRKKGLMKKEGK